VLFFDFTGDNSFSASASLTRPFSLDLDSVLPHPFSQLVGLGASGSLGVNAAVDFALKLGLDLIGVGTNDAGFFIDVNDTKVTATASAFGRDLDFEAMLGPVGVFVFDGEAELNGLFEVKLKDFKDNGRLNLLAFDGSGLSSDLGDLGSFLDTTIAGTGDVTMPLYYGLASSPVAMGELTIDVDLNKLFAGQPGGFDIDFPALPDLQLPSLFSLLSDPSVMVKGLNLALKELQGVLKGELLGFKLPLLGDVLADNPAANFIEGFRLDFLQPLAKELAESNFNLEGLIGLVKDVITDVFTGLGLFGNPNVVTDLILGEIDGTPFAVPFANLTPAQFNAAKALQFEFDIGQAFNVPLVDIDLDIGIPGLGLNATMTPTLEFDWSLHFGFGLHVDEGFYIVTKNLLGNDEPELQFSIELNLGSTIANRATLDANLLFLALELTDGVDFGDGLDFSKLSIDASVDITDPNDTGRLTIPQLITGSPRDIFVFDVTGGAQLLANAEVNFGGFDSAGGLSLANALPSISTDIVVAFEIGFNSLTGLNVQPPEVAFLNITLDLGDFISGFAGDILRTIGDILDPLAWLIGPDGLLNFVIPLISDLAGTDIRVRDLINVFDPDNGPKVNAFLDFVEMVYFITGLVQEASSAAGNIKLQFGDFILFKKNPHNSFFDKLNDPDRLAAAASLALPGGADLRDLTNLSNFNINNLNGATFDQALPSSTQRFHAGVTDPGGITFPILEPANLLGLLLGKPAALFEVEFPTLGFELFYRQVFPIIGPLAATFAGGISGSLTLGFGYDTLGISQTIATGNPAYLLNGFYLNDLDPATGFDRPEAIFAAEIAAGVALSAGVVTFGLDAGIAAEIIFNLNDPDRDGKVRFAEMAANIAANNGNPLAMFDISGAIEFFARAFVEFNILITKIRKEFEFARLTLFKFDIPFERPAVLATQQGDTLVLNIGPNAAARIQGNTADIAETIFVKSVGPNAVVVWSDQFNVSEAIATTNPFVGVSRIVADGGLGNDVIDLSGITHSTISAEIRGGPGDDLIIGGAGNDKLFGDDGNDVIDGTAGNNQIFGVRGNNTLIAGEGNDEIFGGPGNDTIDLALGSGHIVSPGLGNNTIIQGDGNNTFDFSTSGSVSIITGSGPGNSVVDFSDKTEKVTFFFKDDRIIAGFGKQNVATSTILGTSFAGLDFTTAASFQASLILEFGQLPFEKIIGVDDTTGIEKVIGGSEADIFHVQQNKGAITIDGGGEADRFRFYVGTQAINITVHDVGENLKDENVIEIIGTNSADNIKVTSSQIELSATQTVTYVAPSDNPSAFTDQLIIKVFGRGGDDTITVESTNKMVPVIVDAGAGNDTVIVGGGSNGVNNIASFLNANANDGFGFGPLTLIGGPGHDIVIIDDSQDNGPNQGNITAFLEKREGVTDLVEVGVVSGLGMTMTLPDGNGGTLLVNGLVQYEGFAVVDVRLGKGDDEFTIGGGFNLDRNHADGGVWDEVTLSTAQISKTRLVDPDDPKKFGIQSIVHTISGMTIVQGGPGDDDLRILTTQELAEAQSDRVKVVGLAPGGDGQHRIRLDVKDDVGFFVLEFADTGLDSVPGAEQTRVLPYDMFALRAVTPLSTLNPDNIARALGDLRHVGGLGFVESVDVVAPVGDAKRSFIITFNPLLGVLPELRAFDTRLLVSGDAGDDTINVQAINQPTYVLGGVGDDLININVEINDGGSIAMPPPDPLVAPIASPTLTNGVNALLTADGENGDDTYLVHLFGDGVSSQINLFDSGEFGSDNAIILGTENDDLFLLRAAVADDGLAFIAMLTPAIVPDPGHPAIAYDVERVNYNTNLDSIKIFGLDGDDYFGIDDIRGNMEIYGGDGEDFFQVGQLYKSQRTPFAGVPNADIFATLETTRGFLSNGISAPLSIFGGAGDDTFIVYHNLAPLQLFGEDGNDSFLIRAFALVGSEENLRERTDVSGGAGDDLIMYAVNAPVNIDGGSGFNTIIVIGTEFNDDFVITEDGVFGAGLNVTFVNIQQIEIDGDAGDDRFFILGTGAGMITKVTGGLGSDTFFVNGPTPAIVSNDLLGHTGLIGHLVDSDIVSSVFAGLKAVGIAANVADDDEPAIRILESGGVSVVAQGKGDVDDYAVVLTRKPEDDAHVIVRAFAPTGLRFTKVNGEEASNPKIAVLVFTAADWNVAQNIEFTADEQGAAEVSTIVKGDAGKNRNAKQLLVVGATKGTFKLIFDPDGAALETDPITFNRANPVATAAAIATALNALAGVDVVVKHITDRSFEIEFVGATAATHIDHLGVDAELSGDGSFGLLANDIIGVGSGFITHTISVQGGSLLQGDTIKGLFVADDVPGRLQGTGSIEVQAEGGSQQLLVLDATDGNFRLTLVDENLNDGTPQSTAQVRFNSLSELVQPPLQPGEIHPQAVAIAELIEDALKGFAGIDNVTVTPLATNAFHGPFQFLIVFDGPTATLEVDDSGLVIGSRTLTVAGGLPTFITDQGDNALRGATVKVIAGSGIGQIRLVIANDADTIEVNNPWATALDSTSRIEILRYAGVVAPTVLVSIVGDDAPALDVRETGGGTFAVEAPEIHGFFESGQTDPLKLADFITVALVAAPTDDVTVSLDGTDALGNQQLFFVVQDGVNFITVDSLTFTTLNWDEARTVYVLGHQDDLVEGLHKQALKLTASGGGYDGVVSTIIVDIHDDEAPGVLVLEQDGSTNVMETGNGNFDGRASATIVTKTQGLEDTANEVRVLTIAADAGSFRLRLQDSEIAGAENGVETGNILFDKNDLAATASAIQTALNSLPGGVDVVVSVGHAAVPGFDYIGKFTIEFTTPGNTPIANLTVLGPSLIQDDPPILSTPPLSLATEQKPLEQFTQDQYQVVLTRAPQGTASVFTTVEGGFGPDEVQVLKIDATGGSFTLMLRDAFFMGGVERITGPITYDPTDAFTLDEVATDIKVELEALLAAVGVVAPQVSVTPELENGVASFTIVFESPANTNIPELRVNALKLTQDEIITIDVVAEPTRTQRGAGVFGIRAFQPEVEISLDNGATWGFVDSLVFDQDNWFIPQTVLVRAAQDTRVDGMDSKSFPTMLDLANSIQGPLVVTGGMTEDRSADLEREPVMLPGETNFKPSVGAVQQTPEDHDPSFTLTIDLNEVVDGDTAVRTLANGGIAGVTRVVTNTNGAPATATTPALNEVQVLTIDAVEGSFRLLLVDQNLGLTAATGLTGVINYDITDPNNVTNVVSAIKAALDALPGVTVTVEGSKSTFVITFTLPAAQNVATLEVVQSTLTRVGAHVESLADPVHEVQAITIFGNAGQFNLTLDPGGLNENIGPFDFDPQRPQDTAKQIAGALNALGVDVEVVGLNRTYTVTFLSHGPGALAPFAVNTDDIRVDEVQTLTINASAGSYRLSLDGGTTTTDPIAHNADTATLKARLESLVGVDEVEVKRDEIRNGFLYTIRFINPSQDFPTLEVVSSTLERTVKESIETKLRLDLEEPDDLIGFTLEITRGLAKNKQRLIIGGTIDETNTNLWILDINRPWEGGLTTDIPNQFSEFTIENTNPNLLVNENEETDILYLSDADSVVSFRNVVMVDGELVEIFLPAGQLIVRSDQLLGLGMTSGAEEVTIGSGPDQITVPGGISYVGLEELYITLGRGDNIIIEDTHRGATTIDAGFGEDVFDVLRISGHTFLHGGPDADTFNVGENALLDGINALLVLTGDIPQVLVKRLAQGSPINLLANAEGVQEIQQFEVHATDGTFRLGFTSNPKSQPAQFTAPLAFNASAQEVEDALNALDTIEDVGFVTVQRFGAFYRVTFGDEIGVPLLSVDDSGLTMEGPGDVLNIDDSASIINKWALLTPTSLTGLGMGGFFGDGADVSFNEIQTLRIHATAGSFTLSFEAEIGGVPVQFQSAALPHDISAEALDAALEAMFLDYVNAVRQDVDEDVVPPAILGAGDVGGGLVEVAQNDDVYVIRFVGLLSNTDVPQIEVDFDGLILHVELPGGTVVPQQGFASTATRVGGITSEALNEIQRLTIDSNAGPFRLIFGDAKKTENGVDVFANQTVVLHADDEALRANILLALEGLTGIAAGDIAVTESEGEGGLRIFDIEFIRELSSKDLDPLLLSIGEDKALFGAVLPELVTLQDGMDTGMNEVQVLTLDLDAADPGGTFRLELFVPVLERHLLTAPIPFDASADDVRRALQHALARALNNLADNADLSRVREAFKTDFTVVKIENDYIISFQGLTRQTDAGPGVSLLKVHDEELNGTGRVVTRMDGINFYGFEQVNIRLGTGDHVFNVQGTSSGSYKLDTETVHAATNIYLGKGDDQVFVSSNADLDHDTIFKTAGVDDVFEFLTGHLDDIRGNLNLDFGEGRHRLLISDEANEVGKGTLNSPVTISDQIVTPTGIGTFDDVSGAEIQIQGLTKGDITYGAAASGNFFDGIIYWTGFGDDFIRIDGTHGRFASPEVERTTTILNTGLGDDHVTVELHVGEDSFFVLNTSGGRASADPSSFVDDDGNLLDNRSDNDTVRASTSTLPLIIFGGFGNNDIIAGKGDDVVFASFGRVQYVDPNAALVAPPADPTAPFDAATRTALEGEPLIAVFGFGGRGDMISSNIVDPRWIISRHLTLGGSSIIEAMEGDDIAIGGARGDFIDGGYGRDLIFGDAVELFRRDINVNAIPLAAITNPRFQALLGQVIYSRNDIPAALQGLAALPADQYDVGKVLVDREARVLRYLGDTIGDLTLLPDWAEYQIINLFHSFAIEAQEDPEIVAKFKNSFGDDYIAGGPGENMIFGQLGDDIIQGNGSIASAVGENVLNRILNFSAALDLNPSDTDAGHRFQLLDGTDIKFDGAGAVDGTSNTISFAEPHGFIEGQRIAYWNDGEGTDIGGLKSGGLYAVHVDDDNTIQLSAPVGAARILNGTIWLAPETDAHGTMSLPAQPQYLLAITPSFEAATDGDSYIEGGGGNDVVFGNLGQNDIIGGSSSLFSLTEREQRPDGTNFIFGGAGTRLDRNHFVTEDNNNDIIDLEAVHAFNASTITGNNANIFRLVGTNSSDGGSFLRFNYDDPRLPGYSHDLWIIPRAVELLDYTQGGPDFRPDKFDPDHPNYLPDIGPDKDAARGNEIHGESGDDYIYGMAGNSIIFGGAGDDRIIGGWGNNWISGGTGNDGIIGDDGRIFTSRYAELPKANNNNPVALNPTNPNHYAELLNGVFKVDQLNKVISTPGNILKALIHPADVVNGQTIGRLYHTVDLTPFNLDPSHLTGSPQDLYFEPKYANDIIYAGLGSSFVHGGAGDDAMLGSEALQQFYDAPINPGNVLRFDESKIEFADYDEHFPRTKIETFLLNFESLPQVLDLLIDMGILVHGGDRLLLRQGLAPYLIYEMKLPTQVIGGVVYGFIKLDPKFNGTMPDVFQDVKIAETVMFGDLGNDWMVGGPDNNVLFGGFGHDLLNVDNNHDTNGGLNNQEDPLNINIQDFAFGGGGRDVLIANSSGDRLVDWIGEFNSFIVPFAPFGEFTVTRAVSPHIYQFLYDYSEALGADPTRANDMGTDHDRNGEPHGELGLVTQKDKGLWQEQSGAPIDPQPGNIPGGKRLSLRGVDFTSSTSAQAFAIDTGTWYVAQGKYHVSPEQIVGDTFNINQHRFSQGDAVVYSHGAGGSAIGGLTSGATYYVIRLSPHALKLAASAADAAAGKAIDLTTLGSGSKHSLTAGKRSVTFDPAAVLEVTGGDAVAVLHVGEYIPNYFEVLTTLSTSKPLGGVKANGYVIFDYVSPTDFKFAGINVSTNKLEIGQRDASGWKVLSQSNMRLLENTNYNLLLSINGTTATLIVNGGNSLSYNFKPRTDSDGFTYGLNYGLVGLGADNSIGSVNSMVVQRLAPETTLTLVEDFDDGSSEDFAAPLAGDWAILNGRYVGTPGASGMAAVPYDLVINPNSSIALTGSFTTTGLGGFIFDHYGAKDYKFAAVLAASNQVVIGHVAKNGAVTYNAIANITFPVGGEFDLRVTLKGTTVSLALGVKDGLGNTAYHEVLGHVFNAVVVDGQFGLLAMNGTVSFDTVKLATDDPAYLDLSEGMRAATTPGWTAEAPAALTEADVSLVLGAAIDRLVMAFDLDGATAAWLLATEIRIVELPELMLGQVVDGVIMIDVDAAGWGWFVDPTPGNDTEFYPTSDGLRAVPNSEASGRMDLLTVLMHELGHLIGLDHDAGGFMADTLEAGMRLAPAATGAAKSPGGDAQVHVFDEDRGQFVERTEARVLRNLGNGHAKLDPVDDDDWLLEVHSSQLTGSLLDGGAPVAITPDHSANGKDQVRPHRNGLDEQLIKVQADDLADNLAGAGASQAPAANGKANGTAADGSLAKLMVDWNRSFMGFRAASEPV
jgi:Ca2+-binding RTX toxin-like protein